MAKILNQYEWNGKFYAMAELDDGSKIELKSEDGKNFDDLLDRYNKVVMTPVVDTRQKELDDYAEQKWPTLAKAAAVKTPMKDEKSVAEWVDKVQAAKLSVAGNNEEELIP
jgi:hypothetical protein